MACKKVMTTSRFKAYMACEQRHAYRYTEHWEEVLRGPALLVGTCLHIGMEAWWGTRDAKEAVLETQRASKEEGLLEEYPYLATQAAALVALYCEVWAEDEWETIEVEKEFVAPMPDPAFGGTYKDWMIAGKIDVIVRHKKTGHYYLMDHKTANQDVSDGSVYWQKLLFDPQISMYHIGAKHLGYDIKGFIYDVIRKPTTKPRIKTPEDKIKYKKNGEPYANMYLEDETQESYGKRILEAISESIPNYYRRKIFTRSPQELQRFNSEIVTVARRLDIYDKTGLTPLRNAGACSSFGRACPYIEACGGGNIELVKGIEKKEPFTELDTVDGAKD